MDNILVFLFGLYFCYRSFRDFSGSAEHLQEKYQDLPGRKKWQKRRAILEGVIGVGTILFILFQKVKAAVLIIGSIVILAFALTIINNKNYMQQSKPEDNP